MSGAQGSTRVGDATLYLGDVLSVLSGLPDESVHCVVTSPPYWGLRDYGTGTWEGGSAECDHRPEKNRERRFTNGQGLENSKSNTSWAGRDESDPFGSICGECGARRIDQQIGLEETPEQYVAKMVAVFREVRRVLRRDGTCWINLGDSYASGGRDSYGPGTNKGQPKDAPRPKQPDGLKAKDLVGIPWMVAFALRADGWYLRSDIIWSKPNPMPESVTDRPTKAHEYLFLLSKSARYFYDADAVREAHAEPWRGQGEHEKNNWDGYFEGKRGSTETVRQYNPAGRNRRTVWTIATEPFPGAHFATFPRKLVEPCILAGCPEHACPKCGAPWESDTEKSRTFESGSGQERPPDQRKAVGGAWRR